MKRIWGFGREKGMSPLGSASGLQRQGRGVGQKNNTTDNLLLGYHVQDRDLRKIHKAAWMGNAAQVQQILFLAENGVDDRDKMNRTALHLACANGHPEVVTLLVERKCHLNLCDHENRTALMKAVQCQEEKCVNILLENGADPNIRDVSGNTALHYAAFGDNISIIEKLLLYNANTEARNKDNITPLLVAVNENKQQIVEVLVEKAANIHAEDKLKRTPFMLAVNYDSTNVVRLLLQQGIDPFPQDVYGWAADEYAYIKGFNLLNEKLLERTNLKYMGYEIICQHKEEIMLKNSLQNSHPGADKNAEEDSIARLSDKPGPDDSWPTSSSQVLHFGTKNVRKSRIAKLLHSSWRFIKNMREKRGTMKPEDGTLSEDNHPHSENKDMAETLSKPQVRVYGDPLPVLPSSKSLLKPSLKTLAVLGLAKSMSEKPNKDVPHVSGAVDQKGQRILHGQVEGADKNAEEDSIARLSDKPAPDDSWSTSSSQVLDFGTKSMSEKPNKDVPHFSGAVDQKGQRILHGQVEGADKNAEEDSIARLSDKPAPDDSWSTSSSQVLDFGTKSMSEKPNKDVPHVSGAVDQKGQRILHGQVEGADKNAEEDSIARLSDKPAPDDSWSTSSSQVLDFGTKSMSEKPNKDVPHVSGAVDQKGQRILHGQVEGADKNAEEDSIARLSDKPAPDDSWSTSSSQVLDFGTKSMSEKPNKDVPHVSGAVDQKGQRILHGQVEGADKNAEEDSIARLSDKPAPDDSWSTSSSQVLDFGTKSMSEKPNKDVPHVSGAVDQKGQRILHGQVEGADKNAEEDSIARLSDKPAPDDSWSTSSSQVLDFGTKSMSEKPNKDVPHVSGAVDQKGQRILHGQVEGADKNAEEDSIARLSDKPAPDDSWSTSSSQVLDFGTKSMSEKPNKDVPHVSGAVDQKGQRILHGQVEGADKNAEEDSIARLSDKPAPDDSWSTSSSQVLDFGTKSMSEKPNKDVPHVSGAVDQKGQRILHGQVEGADKNAEEDSIARLSDKPAPDDSWSTSSSQVLDFGTKYQVPLKVEEKKKHRGSDMEVSENIYDAAAAGLIPQRQNGKTDNHQLPITENKDSDRREPGLHMRKLKKGENEKGTSKGSVITPVLQKADALTGGPLQKNDGSHFSEKDQHESRPAKKISKKKNKVKKQITSMDDLVDFIQSSKTASEHCELPYSKNFMLLIEQLGMDCKDYAGFLKIQDIRVSYEKLRKLNKKHCKLLMGKMTKMDKMVSALQNELQEAKDMISRLEHQKVEWEREFCSLRCTLKQEEEEEEEEKEERRNTDMLYENIREKLRRKEDEYKKEVETKQQVELALRMLNTELKATKNQVVEERSDTQWQLSPEQKARVLQDGSLNNLFCKQKELEMAHKKTNSKVVARQLQQELADTLKKKSMSEASPEVTSYLRLEDETRDLKKKLAQITSQLQEEQERHGEAVRCAEEMKDHVQKLQVKNATQEATIKHQAAQIQDLENNMIKTSLLQEAQERHAEAERYAEKIKDHMLKLKVKNARQEATIKHQAAQIQDLQSNLLKASLLQEAQERHAEAERYAEKIKDHMLKLKVKNARQEATIKHQAAQIQDLQSNLLKASLLQEAKDREAKDIRYAEKTLEVQNARAEETIKQQAAHIHNLPSNLLKTSLADVLTTELETTSSKYLHLDAKHQVLQESLSMKAFKEECEKLESNNKKLQQEVVKLKQFMEMNMVQRSQVEQYKQEIEERARLDIVEKLHEVNLFLQAQAAARQNLDQLRENNHASMRNQMELRIKDLESQVSTMKTSPDSTKTELETYRQLYLEELKLTTSLRNKLNRAKERLSESNTNFLVERQQHQTLLRTLTMSPGLEPPYCGHFENNLVLNGNLTPRGNLVIPTLNPRPSYDNREASLWKMRQELEERITRALEEDATKFE